MELHSKIFVIGHTGQIGNALVEKLISLGYKNVITRRHSELDFTVQQEVERFFREEKPEYVFYCAGSLGNINYFKSNGASVVYDNIIMQANAIKFAGEYGVKKFMYIGSGAVYGNNLESPFNEEHSIESIQQGGMEPYAVAKIAGLEMCKQFNGYNGCKYIVMLPTHIYGTKNIKRIKNGLIETTIKILHEAKKQNIDTVSLDIWGTGKKSVRQFLYIDDVVEAMLYFMESYTDDMPVNISTDEAVSLDDMVKTVSSIVGYLGNISYQYDKPENGAQRLLSTKKMKSLGWNPKFSLHDGIRDFYRWYCSNQ